MALKDIIGQEKALKILSGCIAKNRLAHAYLFAGESGIGKRLTAVNFAKTLNCRTPTLTLPPRGGGQGWGGKLQTPIDCCDSCPSCIKTDKAIHPDVFFIAPEGDGGQIRIEIIRGLSESLSYKSFEGGWKIAVVDRAEALNQSAANAFLKTLEEPPEQSLLILVSSMPELIPETIRSRCQRINFSPLPLKKMIELLEQNSKRGTQDTPSLTLPSQGEGQGWEGDSELTLLSLLSCGRPGEALEGDLINRRDHSLEEFQILLGNIEGRTWGGRDSMEEWFEWSQLWLRDIAVFKATNRTELLINYDRETEIKNISKRAGLKDILILADKINNIKSHLRFNLNKELTFYYTSLLLKETFGQVLAGGKGE